MDTSIRLEDLALEILILVLGNLSTKELLRIETTSKKVRNAAVGAYEASYGAKPWHRTDNGNVDFRGLAIEQLRHDNDPSGPKWTPQEAMDEILDQHYLCSDATLRDVGVHALLCAGTDRGSPDWIEPVATALMAQGRFREARAQYEKLMNVTVLPERTFLTAARFGWPFEFRCPDARHQVLLERAFLGASAGGNKDILAKLNKRGIPWDFSIKLENAAVLAARTGRTQVLAYLLEEGVDIQGSSSSPEERTLYHAIRNRNVETAQFLIKAGASFSDECFLGAARDQDKRMITYLLSQNPDWAKACLPTGSLVVQHFFNGDISVEDCKAFLLLFIEKGSLNINDEGHDGKTVIHLAAEAGRADLCQLVVSLGADVEAVDNAGMSIIDIASIETNNGVISWLEQRRTDFDRLHTKSSCMRNVL